MNPSKPFAPSTEILSIAAGYEFPISVTGRLTPSSSRYLEAKDTGSPFSWMLVILGATSGVSQSPGHELSLPYHARLLGGCYVLRMRISADILRTNQFWRLIGGRICHPMSLWLRARSIRLRERWKARRGYNGIFTWAVIDALKSGNLSEQSTYIDLLCSLPVRLGQTPVVAGKNKSDRLWFKN